MQTAAAAERNRIERELQRLEARERHLRDELATATTRQDELRTELDVLRRFATDVSAGGEEPRLRVVNGGESAAESAPSGATLLKGAQIRERAVAVLATSDAADLAVHYRTWFELLAQHGYLPAGKDPVATFLTQIGRSPAVKRSTSAGVYALDFEFPDRARARLAELSGDLAKVDLAPAETSVAELGRLRDTRQAISVEIEATERALDEAVRSLSGVAESPVAPSLRG